MKEKEPGLPQYMVKANMHRSESGLTQAFDPVVKIRYNPRKDLGDDSPPNNCLLGSTFLSDPVVLLSLLYNTALEIPFPLLSIIEFVFLV